MKHWHPAKINGKASDASGAPGNLSSYPMDCEDAAMVSAENRLVIEDEIIPETSAENPEGSGQTDKHAQSAQIARQQETFLDRRIDHWIACMERLGLSEYVRYVNDRKRMLWTNFLGGVARGVGTAVGFTILGAILVIFLQNLAKHNLPLIGDTLAQIVSIVQTRLQ